VPSGLVAKHDLTAPEVYVDPYPVYERVLADSPLFRSEQVDGWYALRYRHVRYLLKDAPVSSRLTSVGMSKLPASLQGMIGPLLENFSKWCVLLDPPEHTRLRGLLNRAFSANLINKLTVDIDLAVNELLNKAIRTKPGELDLVQDFAHPLPLIVLGRMIGVEEGDEEKLKIWSDAIARFFGLRYLNLDMIRAALTSLDEAYSHFGRICDKRRQHPQNDLLSAFVHAQASGAVEQAEILAMCTLLIFAGHETTTNFIANGMLTLLTHPKDMERLRNTPALMDSALEELLRYESPLQRATRLALEDIHIDNICIPKGDRIFIILGAANRDPEMFAQPNVVNLERDPNPHLAFGFGRHFCSGAALSRLEGKIGIETLLRRLPGIHLKATQQEWHNSFMLRGLRSLPVSFWPTGAWASALAPE